MYDRAIGPLERFSYRVGAGLPDCAVPRGGFSRSTQLGRANPSHRADRALKCWTRPPGEYAPRLARPQATIADIDQRRADSLPDRVGRACGGVAVDVSGSCARSIAFACGFRIVVARLRGGGACLMVSSRVGCGRWSLASCRTRNRGSPRPRRTASAFVNGAMRSAISRARSRS